MDGMLALKKLLAEGKGEGHVAQLTGSVSQLPLPPSQEEAKAKSWWQFWR
jgi:hypothetical protein